MYIQVHSRLRVYMYFFPILNVIVRNLQNKTFRQAYIHWKQKSVSSWHLLWFKWVNPILTLNKIRIDSQNGVRLLTKDQMQQIFWHPGCQTTKDGLLQDQTIHMDWHPECHP